MSTWGPLREYGIEKLQVEFFDMYRRVGVAATFDDGTRKSFLLELPKEWDEILDRQWKDRHR